TGTQVSIPSGILNVSSYNYWRVIASVPGGESSWSVVWRFNIIFNPPPAPVLLSPADNSTGQPFLTFFDWNDVNTAQYYRIQISRFSNFSTILLDSNRIAVSQFQCPPFTLTTNTQYYWRVNAANSNGFSTSDWSSAWNFTTLDAPEPNSISGVITFADSNFIQLPSYYIVSAYT